MFGKPAYEYHQWLVNCCFSRDELCYNIVAPDRPDKYTPVVEFYMKQRQPYSTELDFGGNVTCNNGGLTLYDGEWVILDTR